MNHVQQKEFDAMCTRFGLTDVQKVEMADFVERVYDAARESGEIAGASPFDGTWPSEQES